MSADTPLTDGARLHKRPSEADLRVFRAALAPWRALTTPRFYGLEHIPTDGPVLLVGNHTIFGLLDLPLMVDEIHSVRGRFTRGLAEHLHLAIPGWRSLVIRAGAVRGTPENCRALLAAGEAVLVYPGGGREVSKRKGEKYRLIWKERTGFARMAIEAGCPIVPFAAVGAEECFDILVDADHPVFTPARAVLERLGFNWGLAPPIVRGFGLTPFPRPQQLSFSFGPPIDTLRWSGRADDDAALCALRDEVRSAVEEHLRFLQSQR
ncbi:MAG: lysophospholipid acyltransferase family protein [Mycobacteriaceae bacterium]